jgi:hypothetical protein
MLEVFSFKNTDVDRRIDSVDLIMVNLKLREIAILQNFGARVANTSFFK